MLTYDGQLNILDAGTGEVLHEVDVVQAWEEPEEWQQPGPAVKVAGDRAYVTDAAAQKLHVVDIAAGTVVDSFDLPEIPNEIAVVDGSPESPSGDDGHDHGDHDHKDDDH
ncbi:YncE family protein [Kocuria sp. CPCC 205300]|uniref:YncE family protein n=1 Tax=Kocuria sabuli TaxID=3071448 RepID=UPI0036D91762